MNLYYDNAKEVFTMHKTESCETVFESYEREERIGYRNGVNQPIKKGDIEINISTNFYPSSPKREYISVRITVNGVRLLPLSMACRKASRLYHFNKHQIAFLQYGAGNNIGRTPVTILKRGEDISWERVLKEICVICNNYRKWIISETKSLIMNLSKHTKADFGNISTLLGLVRTYETIVPDIIPVYREYVDPHCFEAMANILHYINEHQLDNLSKVARREQGDIVWTYIKDYYLS